MHANRPAPQFALMAALTLLAAGSAAAQAAPERAYTPTNLAPDASLPRTADGRPDLQNAHWTTNYFPVLEASPMAATLVVSEEESRRIVDMAARGFLSSDHPSVKIDPEVEHLIGATDGFPLVRGERRSRAVVLPPSGRLPLTPEARAELKAVDPMDKPLDGPEARPLQERCLVMGALAPIASTLALTWIRFVQTPDHVVIHAEYGDEARIVPLTGAHKHGALWSRMGDSIGRWEGDTLVVETVGLPAEERIRAVPSLMVPATARVVERFTRVSADELVYQYTVEDPVYTEPWLAEFSFHRSDKPMFPHECHEGNYSLPNILAGGRTADLRTANGHP